MVPLVPCGKLRPFGLWAVFTARSFRVALLSVLVYVARFALVRSPRVPCPSSGLVLLPFAWSAQFVEQNRKSFLYVIHIVPAAIFPIGQLVAASQRAVVAHARL